MNTMTLGCARLGLVAIAVLATACGGGDGGDPTPPTPPVPTSDVPQSATTSAAGATAFVKSVAAASDNSATPLTVGDAVLAVSETDEPETGI
ncbi:MAG: hypothetical protein ABIR26_13080 [Ramlibacter sp.]